jgi:hypothetical protein
MRLYDCLLDLCPFELDCECVKSTMLKITSLRLVFHFLCTRCCILRIEAEKFCRKVSVTM